MNVTTMVNSIVTAEDRTPGVILVGHGGVPTDCPPHLIRTLKQLETQRRVSGTPMTGEERELDRRVRQWARTPENDPYQAGLESLGKELKSRLDHALFTLAYNEFCAPTLEEAAAALIAQGANHLTVISSMLTPGGAHSEIEIPATIDRLRMEYPDVIIRYAWPFDLSRVAQLLVTRIKMSDDQLMPGQPIARDNGVTPGACRGIPS